MLAGKLNEWFEKSVTPNFGPMFADNWRKNMRGAMSGLDAIVTWSQSGLVTFDIAPDNAVRTIDKALDILGLGLDAQAEQPKDEKPMDDKVAEAEVTRDKTGPQDKVFEEIDFGASVYERHSEDHKGVVYQVSPPGDVATRYEIPEEAVTFLVRSKDGEGRLFIHDDDEDDTASVRSMAQHPVLFHGVASKFVWRKKRQLVVAKFSAEETKAIVG